MKRFKLIGSLAVAIAALMGFADSASADYVSTTTGGTAATPAFHLVGDNGHVTIENVIANISCNSTAEGAVESHGAGVTVGGEISHFTFTSCTNGWHVTTIDGGVLFVDHTSGHSGTLSSLFTRIVATRFGISCEYSTLYTHIGRLTGGNPATLEIEASIPIDPDRSSGLCGTGNAKWQGSYVTTAALYVVNS